MLRRLPPQRGERPILVESEESTIPARPERVHTPLYPVDPTFNYGQVRRSQGIKSVKDRLFGLLRDGRFHLVSELEALLPQGGWVEGMQGLLELDYAFDIVDDHVRARYRRPVETRQFLGDLLATLHIAREPDEVPETAPDDVFDDSFDPTVDVEQSDVVEADVVGAGGDDMVLSDPPEALTLSAANSVCMTAAILAKKQSGKTYLGMVIAEEFIASKAYPVPVVVIDPTGVWYGLRSMEDGRPSPHPMLVLGGHHGDLAITSTDGGKVAMTVLAVRPCPVIVDLSKLDPEDQHELVADFIDKLFVSTSRSPMHIIIDEADEFAPQTLSGSPHQKRCLEAIDRLVRRGRTKGFGVTVITQRSAVISKNILSQVDSLWFLNMVEDRDLLAVENRIKRSVTAQQCRECLNSIPKLPPGTAYFIQTGASPKFRKFKVKHKRSFDSSKTPGTTAYAEPQPVKPPTSILAIAISLFKSQPNSEATVNESNENRVEKNSLKAT